MFYSGFPSPTLLVVGELCATVRGYYLSNRSDVLKRQHRGQRSFRGRIKQHYRRIQTIIRGPTFFDRKKREIIAVQYGSVTVEDRYLWTEPGEVLNDPYGRGTLERIR